MISVSKPIDKELLRHIFQRHKQIITLKTVSLPEASEALFLNLWLMKGLQRRW
jgi:hypothetical protein